MSSTKKRKVKRVPSPEKGTNLKATGTRRYYERRPGSGIEPAEERRKWKDERAQAIREQAEAMHRAADSWAENLLQAIDDEVDVVSENPRSASAAIPSPEASR